MLFDRYVVVDWSANSTPTRGADSIWIGTGDGGARASSVNLGTRALAAEFLEGSVDPERRTLIAVDASLGYPAGTAAALGLDGVPWAATWSLLASSIVDDDRNANNRFSVAEELNRRIGSPPGPFWGCPPRLAGSALTRTKPAVAVLPEWRRVERCLRAGGHRPHSSWQLLGAGSVGGQSLLAIARLEHFRRRHAGRMHVWPFTTGLVAPSCRPGDVVVAEVWPSLVSVPEAGDDRVRDQAQVEDTVSWLAALDGKGALSSVFAPGVGDVDDVAAVVAEEGWVLGVAGATTETVSRG